MGTLENNFMQGEEAVAKQPSGLTEVKPKSLGTSKPCTKGTLRFFISIPITGHPLDEVKERCYKFVDKLKRYIAQEMPSKNVEIIVPFDICPDPTLPYQYYMGKDIEALLTCDDIISMQGWPQSKGCLAEYEVSRIYHLNHSEQYQWEEKFKESGITD